LIVVEFERRMERFGINAKADEAR
jgi:hypothetical protein